MDKRPPFFVFWITLKEDLHTTTGPTVQEVINLQTRYKEKWNRVDTMETIRYLSHLWLFHISLPSRRRGKTTIKTRWIPINFHLYLGTSSEQKQKIRTSSLPRINVSAHPHRYLTNLVRKTLWNLLGKTLLVSSQCFVKSRVVLPRLSNTTVHHYNLNPCLFVLRSLRTHCTKYCTKFNSHFITVTFRGIRITINVTWFRGKSSRSHERIKPKTSRYNKIYLSKIFRPKPKQHLP